MNAMRRAAVSVLLAAALVSVSAAAPGGPREPARAAILFDSAPGPHAKAYIHARFLEILLTHFELRVDLIPTDTYRPGQLAGYRAGFLIGATPGARVPPALLADIRTSTHPFTWMGLHIGSLLDSPEAIRRFGFSFREYRADLGFHSVVYKQTPLSKTDADLTLVSVEDARAAQVMATAVGRKDVSTPYVVRSGRFWYVADAPFSYLTESSRYLAICDLLHDILGVDHPADNRALARIEDVSVDDEPEDLVKIADLLAGRHVPFQISLIPIFMDPARGLEIRLGDRRSTLEALHYMVARGGTPILHGVTHQVRGLSGDEYEFWDELANRPIPGDSAEFVMRRLRLGLAECSENGIFPVAFEVPHYGASETDYRAIARVFSASCDRPMAMADLNTTQLVPYVVTDRFGRKIIPEDLGYLPEDNPDPEVLIRNARNLRVVRDGIASFYFHPFLNRQLLDRVVEGVAEAGYRFVSLRDFGTSVNLDGRYLVRTVSGPVTVTPRDEYWRVRVFDSDGRLVRSEISPKRFNQPQSIALSVPQRGWAAVDCLRNLPREAAGQDDSWMARLKKWWTPGAADRPDRPVAGARSAWLFWTEGASAAASHDQKSYRRVLESAGYDVKLVHGAGFTRAPEDHGVMLVAPEAVGAGFNAAQRRQLLKFLQNGGSVIADGRQPWLEEVGFQFQGGRVPVTTVTDPAHPEATLEWRPHEHIERVRLPDGAQELMSEGEGGRPLAASGTWGAGRYLYLAAPLDNHTDDGVAHYPFFAEYLRNNFGPATPLRSHRIEVYFDPSYRPGADFNRLATLWRKSGISTVYIAAWISTRNFTFPYGEFIRACHRNGVSVYAWFIMPGVSQKMWDEHPEWREKTATGADGRVGWRYSMNLQNPACFRAAMDWMGTLIRENEWDGVNISELNFDADFKDRLRPDKYVPMNSDVRAAFRKSSGFDPVQLFQPESRYYHKRNPGALARFERYREEIVVDWHRRVLAEVEPLRRQRGFEVIVTAMDSLHDNWVRPALGVDSRRIVDLMSEFPFTLQVEDPAPFWRESPDRYLRFAETYRKLVPDPERLMFDVNVVGRPRYLENFPAVAARRRDGTGPHSCQRGFGFRAGGDLFRADRFRLGLGAAAHGARPAGACRAGARRLETGQPLVPAIESSRGSLLRGRWPALAGCRQRRSAVASRPPHGIGRTGVVELRGLGVHLGPRGQLHGRPAGCPFGPHRPALALPVSGARGDDVRPEAAAGSGG